MSDRRRFSPKVFIPLFTAFMGIAGLLNMASSPRFALFQAVEVVRLIACGMCFGAALASLLIFFANPRAGRGQSDLARRYGNIS